MDASRPARALALQTLREQWADFMAREPGTLRGDDPEELHRMRVAHRRLRTSLKVFADVLPPDLVAAEPELQWIGGELGDVRDLDVQLEAMSEASSRLEASPEDVERLLAAIRDEREAARARMLEALTGNRFETLVLQIARNLREQAVIEAQGAGPTIAQTAPAALGERYTRFWKAARKLTPKSPPEDLHKARRRARQLRFATEFVSAAYGEPADDLIEAVKALQDLFGEHQDCYAAIELRRRVRPALSKRAREAARRLDRQDRKRAASLRKEAPAAVKGVKKAWKQLKKSLTS